MSYSVSLQYIFHIRWFIKYVYVQKLPQPKTHIRKLIKSLHYFDWQDVELTVKNVQVRAGFVLHMGSVEGTLSVGDTVKLTVDGVSNFVSVFEWTGLVGFIMLGFVGGGVGGGYRSVFCYEKKKQLKNELRLPPNSCYQILFLRIHNFDIIGF